MSAFLQFTLEFALDVLEKKSLFLMLLGNENSSKLKKK